MASKEAGQWRKDADLFEGLIESLGQGRNVTYSRVCEEDRVMVWIGVNKVLVGGKEVSIDLVVHNLDWLSEYGATGYFEKNTDGQRVRVFMRDGKIILRYPPIEETPPPQLNFFGALN